MGYNEDRSNACKLKYEGNIFSSNKCGDFIVTAYISSSEVYVKFLDSGYICCTETGDIRKGSVRDKLHFSFYGVGYIGQGKYKIDLKNSPKVYDCWSNMLRRCYCTKYHEKAPTYKDCTVSEEWHNYQNFAKWYEDSYIEGYHLDKDIKVEGNRVYGPDTCMFVTRQRNSEKANAKHYIFVSPEGNTTSIYNLDSFCRENNLTPSNMHGILKGVQKQHKGWTKYVPDEDDVVVGGENSIVTCKVGEV